MNSDQHAADPRSVQFHHLLPGYLDEVALRSRCPLLHRLAHGLRGLPLVQQGHLLGRALDELAAYQLVALGLVQHASHPLYGARR